MTAVFNGDDGIMIKRLKPGKRFSMATVHGCLAYVAWQLPDDPPIIHYGHAFDDAPDASPGHRARRSDLASAS